MADEPLSKSDAERLRLSEARLRGVLNSISDGFYAVNRAWRITEFNPAAEAYFNMERAKVVGQDLWSFIPNASDQFQAMLRAAMDGAPMAVLEAPSLLRPGRYVELRIAPTEEGLCVALTDITERRQTRAQLEAAVAERTAELQASQDRLRTIIETSHLFLGLVAPDGTILDANTASIEAINAKRGDFAGVKFWETTWFIGTPGMVEMAQEAVARVAKGETFAQHIVLELPTGVRSFDFSMRPVLDENGVVVAMVPEAAETTARLQAEEELRQAQKLEAVGQLTGGVAHDFNNLLMVISGGLNMMRRSDEPARREMLMARMQEAVDRGANLTRQLLAFSRRHALNPEPIALDSYLAGLNDLLGRSLGGGVRVIIDVAPGVSPVMADANALQLAILNLAVNARDAMSGSGTVTIRARDGAPDNSGASLVSISVSDTGVGMAADVLERIFEPFFTTKDIGKGSGLGLAQVHGFAEQSGGRIEVDTAPGKGTCMTLVLPRAGAVRAAEEMPAAPVAPQAAQRGAVLLVEDDDEVAAMTGEMLEHLGWRVTRVASAEAALSAVASGPPVDLVFSDVMMPGGKNGIELARALQRRPHAPRIVLTSGYAESVRREAEVVGVPLLAKPFDIDALEGVLG
ncbi:ATP-binding protein [Terricaulis sp.]|uniref:hybrid sensor histidine kinase/response regulator n=1 Tax=Terricaulis sp. TaxID=2768686 RepID=UPI003784BEEF